MREIALKTNITDLSVNKPNKAAQNSANESRNFQIVAEVARICTQSDRIQQGGEIRSSQLSLARHCLSKCVEYYKLRSNTNLI